MPRILMAFPEGRYKVLTMSYDDGRTADRRLVKLFNQHGIKGTFHLNAGLLGSGDRLTRAEVEKLYLGHEVSAHTFTHPTIARCPREQLIDEIIEDRKHLESLVGYSVRGLSYPNGSFNTQIKTLLPHLGIEYARTVQSTGQFSMPDDLFEWNPTCHHKRDLLQTTEHFLELHKSQYLYMMYVWGHSYEFDIDGNWELIERFCAMAGNRDEIWYATNMEIVDYMKAFNRLEFSASCRFVYNPSVLSVWLYVGDRLIEVQGGCQVQLT